MLFQERVQAVMDWIETPIGSMPARNGKKTLHEITKELKNIAWEMNKYSLSLDQKIERKIEDHVKAHFERAPDGYTFRITMCIDPREIAALKHSQHRWGSDSGFIEHLERYVARQAGDAVKAYLRVESTRSDI